MAAIHYLTVQDILWINLQVTKKVNHYNFARLEEATFYQYAYGESNSLLKQAARFLPGFLRMKPFDSGNLATAGVAFLAFLELNHSPLNVGDDQLIGWFDQASKNRTSTLEALSGNVRESDHHGHDLSVRQAIQTVVSKYETSVIALSQRELTESAR